MLITALCDYLTGAKYNKKSLQIICGVNDASVLPAKNKPLKYQILKKWAKTYEKFRLVMLRLW